ncbi:MAG TPA: hypothetical protein VHB77_11880, partial [Planctomycetaceae bacterium]|nr:hypothetical protein [Planctomycetaceae bacterium]
MQERSVIAREAAAGLRRFADQRSKFPVLIGFDGFVDSIIAVVDKRHDVEHYEPMETIDQLGRRILAAAGQSSNFELVVKLEKLGGNGPIYANAMMALGFPVTYIGARGWPEPHPVFADLNKRARCYSLGPPGMTDAFEFRDGKLMFGKHDALKAVNWKAIEDIIGVDKFAEIIAESRLIGTVNWTMLTRLNEIWRKLIDELLPACKGPRKLIFVDLADPEKRLRED